MCRHLDMWVSDKILDDGSLMKGLSHPRDLEWRITRMSDSDGHKITMSLDMCIIQNSSGTEFAQYSCLLLEWSGWSQILCQDESSFRTSATTASQRRSFTEKGSETWRSACHLLRDHHSKDGLPAFASIWESSNSQCLWRACSVGRPTWTVRGDGTKETVRSRSSDVKRMSDVYVDAIPLVRIKTISVQCLTCVVGHGSDRQRMWGRMVRDWELDQVFVCDVFIFVPLRDGRLRSGLHLCHANWRWSCDIQFCLQLKARTRPSSDYFCKQEDRIRTIRKSLTIWRKRRIPRQDEDGEKPKIRRRTMRRDANTLWDSYGGRTQDGNECVEKSKIWLRRQFTRHLNPARF